MLYVSDDSVRSARLTQPVVRRLWSLRTLTAAAVAVAFLAACGSGNNPRSVRIEATEPRAAAPTGGAAQGAGGAVPTTSPVAARPTVFIDAGHGGSDPGWGSSFVAANLPPEKDLNLDVAKRTAAYLEAAGYRVVLSRTDDRQLNDPKKDVNGDGCIDPIDEIQARIDLANASGAAALLSIHFNGMPGTQLSGSGTFYNAVRDFGDRNKRLADLIQEAQLKTLAGFGHQARDWGAVRDDSLSTGSRSECLTSKYYALLGPMLPGRPRPSMMPGVIAEVMFLTFPKEAELAGRADVRDALARGFAQAMERFLNPDRSGVPPAASTSVAASVASVPARLIERGPTAAREVALTFDAGSGAGYTDAILELLARKGLRATFGLTGKWCDANPAIARRIADDGHAIMNHTYSHASWTGKSPTTKPLTADQRRAEVERAEEALQRATGQTGKPLFRSPFGDEDAAARDELGALGYRYNVLWSFDTRAWKGAKADEIVKNGVRAAAPGAIYVLHVAEQQDMLALERLIDGIAAAGFSFVTVPQMLAGQ